MYRWVIFCLAGIMLACGSESNTNQAASVDGGASPDEGGGTFDVGAAADTGGHPQLNLASACGHAFDVLYGGKCHKPTVPPDELARIRPRYEQWCQSEYSLPGVTTTAERLDACASALAASACYPNPLPDACNMVPGTEPGGAVCNGRPQCESNFCNPGASPDGAVSFPICGTCSAAIREGQPCDPTAPTTCMGDTLCEPAGEGGTTCQAVARGDVGASCGTSALVKCKTDLYCDKTNHCAARGDVGAQCSGQIACMSMLQCVGAPTGTCQVGAQAGTACSVLNGCAPGLSCSAGTCVSIGWAMPGQPCSTMATCLVGALDYCPFGATPQGTCPSVIADGQPCDANDVTTTCDTFAACLDGRCGLKDVVCK